jgi:pyruvate dehydrogenase E2 component (dihydrolipoamide acetyltransferase)
VTEDAPPYGEVTRTRMTRTQRLIAERMVASRSSVPEFTVTSTVAMDAAIEWLRTAKASAETGRGPSINDLVIRASALALRSHSRANGRYADDGYLESSERVNVGMAVAAPDTLLVPTVFDADRKSISELARETRDLVRRARDGALSPAEMSGATFTVSNLGMLGVEQFSAVINAPQAAILSVGAVRRAPVVRGDVVAVGLVATLTLNCDHRVVYGTDAAELLTAIQRILEAPEALAGP